MSAAAPPLFNIEPNTERRVASSLMVPDRYTSTAFHAVAGAAHQVVERDGILPLDGTRRLFTRRPVLRGSLAPSTSKRSPE